MDKILSDALQIAGERNGAYISEATVDGVVYTTVEGELIGIDTEDIRHSLLSKEDKLSQRLTVLEELQSK